MENELINEEVKTFTIEEVNSIKSSLDDKYLRLMAEFDNYKKRSQKEKESIKIKTKIDTLSSVLDIDSDLSIAIKQDPNNDGLKILASKLDSFLKSQNIESIQTDTYDEGLHEVISIVEIGEEKIIDVVSKGYTIDNVPFRFPKLILGK